jgi:hypothetical protein
MTRPLEVPWGQQGISSLQGALMDKSKLNFIIDALMFLCLMAMAGLGFLMEYVLLPGRKAWTKYGRNVDLTWLGWNRHDWGEIHLYLAFTLLGLLFIHLVLHWQMILGLYARLLPDPRARSRLAWAVLVLTVLLLTFPFLVTPEVRDRGRGGGGQSRIHSDLKVTFSSADSLAQLGNRDTENPYERRYPGT